MVEIRPEPTPEEREAILIALAQVLRPAVPAQPVVSRWARAGRLTALDRLPGLSMGWGRGRGWPVASAISDD
ncbi:MAG: hypothetical protein U0031_10350 [Thermomicrobiales bacterium]